MATYRVQFIDSGLFTASDVDSLEAAVQEILDMATFPDGAVRVEIELDTDA